MSESLSTPLRWTFGLALYAHACFLLGLAKLLRPVPLAIVAIAIAIPLAMKLPKPRWTSLAFAPLIVLALYPALAFDETLYHLPFVQAFAREGALRFHPELRFPVFPVLQEVLCVPAFLAGGDVATHLVSLVELMLIAALLVDWDQRAGMLAAALFLGSPLVVQLGAVLYVEIALTLFVVAGFLALAREHDALAGFFLGSACSVKYLGIFFAVTALVVALVRRRGGKFAAACAATALPTTAWIWLHTGDPLFPFASHNPWALAEPAAATIADRVLLLWNVTFARARAGMQPPVTPWLLPMIALVIVAAVQRDRRARLVLLLGAAYLIAFQFLPMDARYLAPLLPLVSLAAAAFLVARWPRLVPLFVVLAIAPGLAYAGYRVAKQGSPFGDRDAWLAQRVPEYRALGHAGSERIYVCRAEQLKAYAQGELLGDHAGPFSYARVLPGPNDTRTIAASLERIDACWYLVARRDCDPPRDRGGMTLVYEDEAAQLWRTGTCRAHPRLPLRSR